MCRPASCGAACCDLDRLGGVFCSASRILHEIFPEEHLPSDPARPSSPRASAHAPGPAAAADKRDPAAHPLPAATERLPAAGGDEPQPADTSRAAKRRRQRSARRRRHRPPPGTSESPEARTLRLGIKYAQDPDSLTPDEKQFWVNSFPRAHRTTLKHEHVMHLFDSDALTLGVLRQCWSKDLNRNVRILCVNGQIDKAAKLVDHLVDNHKANQHTFAMFFDGCAQVQELPPAFSYWATWAKAGLLDQMGPAASSALIKCAVTSDLGRAGDVLLVLRDWRAPLNRQSYNILMHAYCGAGRMADALNILGVMQLAPDPDLQPDMFTYQHIVQGIERSRSWDLVSVIFEHMERQGIEPDELLALALMKAFAAQRDVPTVERIFADLEQPNHMHYNVLLIANARAGDVKRCDEVLREMLSLSVGPDSHTVLALLTAEARAKFSSPASVARILRLMDDHNIPNNTFVCTGVINALRNCKALPPESRKALVLREFARMQEAGIDVTAETVNSMICALSECGDPRAALGMLDRMSLLGIQPTLYTYNLLITIATDNGWLHKAEELEQLQSTMTFLLGRPRRNSLNGRMLG